MLLATTENIPGREIKRYLGLVKGSTVRARHVGHDIIAGLKNIVGGEISEYTKMMSEAREQALMRMIADAEQLGADAIVGIRFTTSNIMQGASELMAYGTAVKVS